MKNYRVMVKEFKDSIIFMHKIARGSANKSFGIEVAKLAGLPEELISRAKEVLSTIENTEKLEVSFDGETTQKANPNATEIVNILKDIDMDTISPLMAFGTLQNLVDKAKK